VFLARELALDRAVVIKVLPPDTAGTVSTERFNREIRLAAQLQHGHTVPLLSAGTSAGLPFYTMPLVQGETLRARLAHEHGLVGRRADVARQRAIEERRGLGNSPDSLRTIIDLAAGDFTSALAAMERGVRNREPLLGR
jgi:serine/threonine-protein kinase